MAHQRITMRGPSTTVSVGGPTKRITLNRSTVAKIHANRSTTVASRPTNVQVDANAPRLTVGGMGAQGPRGEQGFTGASDSGVPPVAFGYGDASGTIWSPDVAGTLVLARIVFSTAYDGSGAAVAIGTLAEPNSILAATDNDPATAGEYEVTADKHLGAGEAVRLTNTPGIGASQGAGLIYLTFLPD
jgi:hypothetical protein